MRLFLLPISTRRTLLYCQKLQPLPQDKLSLSDKAIARAAKLWAEWEKRERGWQKTVVNYGNKALRRIPYEEWGLKSVPSLSARRKKEEILGKEKNFLIFPESIIPSEQASQVLHTLATERESLHRSKMWWSFVGMPLCAPFALVPIIPNLPFFYLVFRAWSHYRALAGGKHIQWLLSNKFFTLSPSKVLDSVYPTRLSSYLSHNSKLLEPSSKTNTTPPDEEKMLLTQESGLQLVQFLDIPELEVEVERAIWQVETSIQQEQARDKASSTDTRTPPDEK
ncbi:mitochondrial K+-H+ exchange-related-domain-containing protein [Xylariaceae sp. FL0255]|nr:mitochondrial K+-H+ exchange-related-domain-containing protein [Xylariaceae sp. FL0255]